MEKMKEQDFENFRRMQDNNFTENELVCSLIENLFWEKLIINQL